MTPEQIITAVALLLSTDANPAFDTLRAGGYDPHYPVEIIACPETTSPLDVEGHSLICGTVSVPEDYSMPENRRVALRFVLGRAHSSNPFDDPVVYLLGGPAGGALKSIAQVTDTILGNFRVHRDVVSFDQRAAMLSSETVRCYDNMAEHIVDIARSVEGVADPDADQTFDMTAFNMACVEELYASEADLGQYNTPNNARDVRAVMSALGYPTYNIFGISYGTRLALEVLRTAPDGVRSVIIDGVAPPTVKLYDDLFPPHQDAMDALFEQCAADTACNAAYPDLQQKFAELGAALEANPIPAVRGLSPVNADVLYSVINARTSFSQAWAHDLTRFLPRIIYELSDGDPTTFDWYVQTFGEADTASASTDMAGVTARLSQDEQVLAEAIVQSAQMSQSLNDTVKTMLDQLKHDIAINRVNVNVAEAFDRLATAALAGMTRTDAQQAMQDYARLQTAAPSRAVLSNWVRSHIIGPERRTLLDLISAMSDADITRTFVIADEEITKYQQIVESDLGLQIYACQEDFPYNSLAGYNAVVASFPYDLITTPDTVADFAAFYETCSHFKPVGTPDFHTPVVSNVPVLSLGGTNDTQTSWKWSALAAETLPNARVVIFPNAGHGSSLYSKCGQDMTAKFIIDPEASLDESCVGNLLPKWVLPEDALQ